MMNAIKFTDICDSVKEMNKTQLEELARVATERIEERQERFEQLCAGFYDYLHTIQEEFPNAKVYLIHGNAEKFDVMYCIIPEKEWEICEIGD